MDQMQTQSPFTAYAMTSDRRTKFRLKAEMDLLPSTLNLDLGTAPPGITGLTVSKSTHPASGMRMWVC